MFKISLVIAFVIVGFKVSATSSFDDCILKNMKGVNSDLAAKIVRKSCRNKFPMEPKYIEVELPEQELSKVEVKLEHYDGKTIIGDMFNGSLSWVVTQVFIRFTEVESQEYRDYKVTVRKRKKCDFPIAKKDEQSCNFDALFLSATLKSDGVRPTEIGYVEFDPVALDKKVNFYVINAIGYEI